MTTQAPHSVRYRWRNYGLLGAAGSDLFDPHAYGIHPGDINSSIARGYLCHYRVSWGKLYLSQVNIGLNEEDRARAARGEGPVLFGTLPEDDKVTISAYNLGKEMQLEELTVYRGHRYRFRNVVIPFSGGLLLATDFIPEFMGYLDFRHPVYEFKTVHELDFEQGRLVRAADRSRVMAQFRREFEEMVYEPLRSEYRWGEDDIETVLARAEKQEATRRAMNEWFDARLMFKYGWW